MKNCILLFFGISIVIFSCKKKPLEPVFTQNTNTPSVGMVYPKRIEIEDSILKSKATIYVTYTADSLVSSIKRKINTPNASLDSTLEQNFTYEGKNVKTITTRWEYQPAGIKSNVYTEEKYNYAQDRILNYQLITHNYGGVEPDTRDTVKYDYFVLKKSDGLDYYSNLSLDGIQNIVIGTNLDINNSKNIQRIDFETEIRDRINDINVPYIRSVHSSLGDYKYVGNNKYDNTISYKNFSFELYSLAYQYTPNLVLENQKFECINCGQNEIHLFPIYVFKSLCLFDVKQYTWNNMFTDITYTNVLNRFPIDIFSTYKSVHNTLQVNGIKITTIEFYTKFEYVLDKNKTIQKISLSNYDSKKELEKKINYIFNY